MVFRDGNLFRANLENGSGTIEGRVNGLSTGPLPHGQKMILPNDLPGTVGSLDLVVNGQVFPVCGGLETYTQSRPQDVGMLFSEIKSSGAGGTPAQAEDALVVAVPPMLAGVGPGEGDYDLDLAPDNALAWIEDTMQKREMAVGIARGVEITARGCPFYNRCPIAIDGTCDREDPPIREDKPGHEIACHHTQAEIEEYANQPATTLALTHALLFLVSVCVYR